MRGHSVNRSRRDFARLFAVGGSAALFSARPSAWPTTAIQQAPPDPDERYWTRVREAFIMPPGFALPERCEPVPLARHGRSGSGSRSPFGGRRSLGPEPGENA